MWKACVLMALLGAGSGSPAEDLSGVWILNVQKSTWARMRAPTSVYLRIEQAQNAICYSGMVIYADNDSREFSFDGAIDGKEYPAMRSYGSGRLMLRRADDRTVETIYTSTDGLYVETSRTVVSPDSKRMTRYMRLRGPDGSRSWIEVYERKIG